MVTVAEFLTYTEAMVARASLEANGIKCFIPNENSIRIRGGLSAGLGLADNGIELQVAERDARAARKYLDHVRG